MSIKQTAIRVGELLQDSGIVRPEEMIEAIQVSKRLGVPIGRVLMMSGWVRADELEAALHSQVLLRTEQIPRDIALSALKRVHELRITLMDALSSEEFKPQIEDNPVLLAELLLDSNLVSPEQIETAYEKSQISGIPLASALVLQGVLSPNLFPSIQRIQQLIEQGELSHDEGVFQVQNTFMLWLKAEESLNKDTFPDGGSVSPQAHLLSNLPLNAPLTSEFEHAAPEQAPAVREMAQSEITGEYPEVTPAEVKLSENQHTSPDLHLNQNQIQNQAQSQIQAKSQTETEIETVSELRLVDLLKMSGLITQEDIQKRYQAMLKDPIESGRFFIELGLLDEEQVKTAIRSHSLLNRGLLSQEEAVFALKDNGAPAADGDARNARVQRYMDKQWRGKMSRALGGALIGALVAGLTLSSKREKK